MLIKKQYSKLELILAYLFILMLSRAAECYAIRDVEMLILIPMVMISTYAILQEVIVLFNFIIKQVKK